MINRIIKQTFHTQKCPNGKTIMELQIKAQEDTDTGLSTPPTS